MPSARKQTSRRADYQGTYVIPVIGPKASGKSSFINQLLGAEVMEVGRKLDSGTTELKSIEVPGELVRRKIPLWDPELAKLVMLDTPGYNDDILADNTTIIQKFYEIPHLLEQTYKQDWSLAGVIYLHDISLARGTAPAAKIFFRAFDKLWDEGTRKFIVLGTTKWARIPASDTRIAKCREEDLQKLWKDMGGKGWVVQRVDDEHTSPWMLVERVLLKNKSPTFQKRSKKAQFEKYEGNYIIPIMGPTGAGKSSFINQLLGSDEVKVGHDLMSCTTHLQPVEVSAKIVNDKLVHWCRSDQTPTKKLVIVDTPGFDDTWADDSQVLKRVADWLAASYGAGAKLAGVIYLQDITAYRITGATQKNFDVFDRLCGKACSSVVLGTTKWVDIQDIRVIMEKRETDLRNIYWKDMIARGSNMYRTDDKATHASPWDLVRAVLHDKNEPHPLLIQQEMVEMHKSLLQTEAASVLRGKMEKLMRELESQGASDEEIRVLAREVAALKEKSIFERFFKRVFA